MTMVEAAGSANGEAREVTVRYFAAVRETIGLGEETVTVPPTVATVGAFLDWLRWRDASYASALAPERQLRVAVDKVHALPETSIMAAREIAVFPMMTGG